MENKVGIKFFYQIKGGVIGEFRISEWKIVDAGYIEAVDRKEARAKIEEQSGYPLCMRSKKADIGVKNHFFLAIYENTPYWDDVWNRGIDCEACGKTYTKLQRDLAHNFKYIKSGYCCHACEKSGDKDRYLKRFDELADGLHDHVIYRISNKKTLQSYIGQTTQVFTLRWYQHFFQASDTKFHQALKSSDITDWNFEVIETIDDKDSINEREQFWIEQFDSIDNGYNSVAAMRATIKKGKK